MASSPATISKSDPKNFLPPISFHKNIQNSSIPPMKKNYPVIIVGGGLAGLANAIHLAQSRIEVLLIEKQDYPYHKVCGEYISNEVLPYLQYLGVDIPALHPAKLTEFSLTHLSGRTLRCNLPLGGFASPASPSTISSISEPLK